MTDRAQSVGNTWLDLLETPAARKAISRLTDGIIQTFPDCSPTHASLWAQQMHSARQSAHHLFHAGKSDKEAFRKFQRDIAKAVKSLKSLSPWAKDAIGLALYQNSFDPAAKDLLGDLSLIVRDLSQAAASAEEILNEGNVMGQTNWVAVGVVGEARRCWQDLAGKSAPENLNAESPFADFLRLVFDTMNVGANPTAANEAWHRNLRR